MPVATTQLETFVTPDELKDVILDFESYPELLKEITKVEVHERSDVNVEATFHIDIAFMGFNIQSHYRVRYAIDGLTITWDLVESPTLTLNRGSWKLIETDDGETIGHYEAEIETNLPIPPEIQAAFAESELPKLMEQFRDRAEG